MKRLVYAKVIYADWKKVDIYNTDITNVLTDAMINNSIVKINYKNSGWRNCLPYGWYVSKDGNTLLYVYKEDLSIRSYRLDRIIELYIDDKLDTDINKEQSYFDDFQILQLDNAQEIQEISDNEQGVENPFDESLNILEDDFKRVEQDDWRTLNTLYNKQQEQQQSEQMPSTQIDFNETNHIAANRISQRIAHNRLKRLVATNFY